MASCHPHADQVDGNGNADDDIDAALTDLQVSLEGSSVSKGGDITRIPELADYLRYVKLVSHYLGYVKLVSVSEYVGLIYYYLTTSYMTTCRKMDIWSMKTSSLKSWRSKSNDDVSDGDVEPPNS